jgi:ATP-dependent protease ClpP protease subunit
VTVIDVKGAIVRNSDKWIYDWCEIEATCPKDVISKLREFVNDEIEIHINSGGGNVNAGMEIYTALKEHKGKVTCKIVGLAASAASIIAMAANVVKITPVGQVMIHKASALASGNHAVMDHISDVLQSHDEGIANAYMLKTGMDREEILDLMGKETYFSAQKALEHGFVDEIMFDEGLQLSASASTPEGVELPPELINKVKNLLMKNSVQAPEVGPFLVPNIENGVENPQPTSSEEKKKETEIDLKLKDQQEKFRKLRLKIIGGMCK